MGRGQTGGVLAAPIFTEFMKVALADTPPKEFQVPPGIELIPIDRRTGLRAQGGGGDVILEAFKPGTAPPTTYSVIGYQDITAMGGAGIGVSPEADRAVSSGTGGLY